MLFFEKYLKNNDETTAYKNLTEYTEFTVKQRSLRLNFKCVGFEITLIKSDNLHICANAILLELCKIVIFFLW